MDLSSTSSTYENIGSDDPEDNYMYDPRDDTYSLIDAMMRQMSSHHADMTLLEQRRVERDAVHLQLKMVEKAKDREMTERLALLQAEERQKDRLSVERLAQLKSDRFSKDSREFIHEPTAIKKNASHGGVFFGLLMIVLLSIVSAVAVMYMRDEHDLYDIIMKLRGMFLLMI